MMHEYSIIQSLVDSVARAVDGQRGASVHRLQVSIGELSGVDCDLLATAYDVFRDGTLCQRATLSIDRIPARWECERCGSAIERGAFLRCTLCEGAAHLVAGDEIVLQRIELEVS